MDYKQVLEIFERYLQEKENSPDMVDMSMVFAVGKVLPLIKKELPVKPSHNKGSAYFCGQCHEPLKIWNTVCGTCGYKIDWSDFAET